MQTAKVRELGSTERLIYFINERESIRLKKAAGQVRPWTDDEILQSYRFCNIRRQDDKVSRWLTDNWYAPNYNHPNMLPAIALARLVNNPAALARVRFPKRWNPETILHRLKVFRADGYTVFNSAYMVRGGKLGGDKLQEVVYDYCDPLRKVNVPTDTMQAAHAAINACYGFGSFMAGQVVADLRWAVDGAWADRDDWAPLGPGSKRGMNRLLDRPVDAPLSQAQFLEYLRWMMQEVKARVPVSITERLEAMDYQNICCEFSKFEKALWDGKRLKQRYPGV